MEEEQQSNETAYRVNGRHLAEAKGEMVRFIGEVVSQSGQSATLRASDGVEVAIYREEGGNYESKYVEVIGTVRPDLTIDELINTKISDTFNMAQYDKVVELSWGPYRHLFYPNREQ
eukprot:gnl/Trimastix_PCT/3458.p2 GENE.gnl/Trimastix_PCT/3458~~gnl/Trimastix_PCT/3458.p2  ORF type:complete len:132 (-),score=11.93 gnl/Trimastix_PCT/3458:9-359(-)